MDKSTDSTLAYYGCNASAYFDETVSLPPIPARERFIGLLSTGATILDLGCGSGRDSAFFRKKGFRVTAVDASPQLALLASTYIGQVVHAMRFDDIAYESCFDGIWACASLLHCARGEIRSIFGRCVRALSIGGVWYMSFKHGDCERIDDRGRCFTDYTPESLRSTLDELNTVSILDIWTEVSQLRNADQCWVNALVKRER